MSFFSLSAWTTAGVSVLLLIVSLRPVSAQSSSDDLGQVRVRLNHQSTVEQIEVRVEEGPMAVHLPNDGAPIMRLQSGETTTLGVRQEEVYLQRGGRGLYSTKLTVQPAGNAASWTLSVDGQDDRTYTGGLYLAPDPDQKSDLLVVNEVPIEDYVASVVASEYGLGDREGTKAMAVVARTYGLFASEKFGDAYDQADGTASQVYEGIDAVTERSREATQATEGDVLTYNANLIQAVYHSSSGGHTANNEDVWKAEKALPYLRGRDDPYDESSPHHTWSVTVDRSSLLQALTQKRGTLVEGFTIDEQAPHGRVRTIRVLQSSGSNYTMNANAFRLVVNRHVSNAVLKSTWFDARRQGDQYVFNGRGFGHGVGLSQYGAHEMAERGQSYREILRFYYTDVDIDEVDDVEFDPVTAPVAKEPSVSRSDSTSRRIGW
jgi:stage II sporulation protein D